MIQKTLLFIVLTGLISCQSKGPKLVPDSNGNIHTITVVMPTILWEGKVGQAVRDTYGSETKGLPQIEPYFTLIQMPPEAFTGFARSSRLLLWIGISDEQVSRLDSNPFARPQRMGVIADISEAGLVEKIHATSSSWMKKFHTVEITERQRRTRKSLAKNIDLSTLGISLEIPSAYTLFKEEDNAFWLQRSLQKGNINLLAYRIAEGAISFSSPQNDIIEMRDSLGKAFVPGRLENSYLITEAAYEPYFFKTKVSGFKTLETRGTWEVKADFMAGPFLNFVLKDTINHELLVLEGFVFAPSIEKRDYMVEVEAILRSVKIVKKK